MAGYVQVKAIMLKEDGKKEVRRFRLGDEEEEKRGRRNEMGAERGGGSSGRRDFPRFMNLLTRVQSVFNMDTATQQHCTLYWRDEDDDMVHFSTDEELGHALEHSADDTFRVYVIVSDGSNMEEDDDLEEEAEVTREKHVTFDVTPPYTDPSTVSRVTCPGMHCGHVGRKGRHAEWKMNKMRQAGKNSEFKKLREKVPEQFRSWVRQFVRAWYAHGPETETAKSMEAAMAAVKDKLPEQVDKQFPEWLHAFLIRHRPKQGAGSPPGKGEGDGEIGMEVGEREECPEGLPSAYFQWLCLFLPRFFWRQRHGLASRSECDGEGRGCHGDGHVTRGHKGHGKHGCHRGRKGDKQGMTSSESEDSESEHKKLPKEFRQYVRITMKRHHKSKGDINATIKDKETVTGVSPEVREFVEQILLEWHAKLSRQRPRAVAMEMMAEDRSLPAGMQQGHFQWLCRFMARWHRRHAGKCDVMSGWSSGETSTSTDEEAVCGGHQASSPWPYTNRRHFRAAMKMMKMQGMMVHPGPQFSTHPGMYYTYAMSTPYGPKCGAKRCGKISSCAQQDGGKCRKVQDGAAQGKAAPTHDEMMERVTEDVKNM